MDLTRRQFMGSAAAIGATLVSKRNYHSFSFDDVSSSSVILFQGDSVTDNFHNRTIGDANIDRALGTGYPFLIASEELREHPASGFRFFNRGVSGNKIPDLEARWQTDTLDLKPDLLSILIGVNDFWHTLLNGYTGTLQTYQSRYLALIENTRKALPNVRLVIIEPFALRGKFVDDKWYPAFAGYQAAAKEVARQASATFVPLQHAFDKASARTGPAYWTADGVHPTPAGHALIAEEWRKAVHL
jgi:lysophospholipase L1-like esterase